MINVKRVFIATLTFLIVSILSSLLIKPFSVVNFVGPAAGIACAFTMLWGAQIAISVVLGTFLFSGFLMLTYQDPLSLSVLLISILAICFQCFWVNQLTYKTIHKQGWLKSRSVLFSFIMRIGPIASIVSATAVIVLSMLDEKIITNSVDYVFFTSWAGGVLTAVFFTPLLLFSHGEQALKKSKRFFVLFVSMLGLLAIVLLFKIFYSAQQDQRYDAFNTVKNKIEETINHEVRKVNEQLLSLAALFKSTEHMSVEEFTKFSRFVFQGNSSVESLEWAPLIADKMRRSFEQKASSEINKNYIITEELLSGDIITASDKDQYLPIYYIYPQELSVRKRGIDILAHTDKQTAMQQSLTHNKVVASEPLKLTQLDNIISGVFVFYPVINNRAINPFGPLDAEQNLNGYILAKVNFDVIFEQMRAAQNANTVVLYIQDQTHFEPYILNGENIKGNGRVSDVIDIEVFGRQWQVQLTERTPWVTQDKAWNVWAMLIGVTTAGVVFQLLVLMMAAYSIELSHQVVLKTRELIMEKETSEQKNQVNNSFLKTLSDELKTPILAIKFYIAKFEQHPTFTEAERSMNDINNASQNLNQLIDNINVLNEIESGTKNIVQLSVFDFHHFIEKLHTLINAQNETKVTITFIINENVPYLIESDELRMQKLVVALIKNAEGIFKSSHLSVSIKAHIHQLKRMTLFFVITPIEAEEERNELLNEKNKVLIESDLSTYSTSMAMAKELSHLLGGDIKLNESPTGMLLLNTSLKVGLPSTNVVET